MSRMVNCSKYQKELAGLEKQPIPGAQGEKIFAEVSEKAWLEWQTLQTMLINEKHLSLIDPETRKYLLDQMWRFFKNEEVDQPEGYTPAQDS
ncbi:oxidative damage protection protein [Pseudomonadales bacterium]|jgi:Fe-S cluster biosynthesis and repair protein YggX|nr:oxidative damage protection protein [Pseudomonadales bacterium]